MYRISVFHRFFQRPLTVRNVIWSWVQFSVVMELWVLDCKNDLQWTFHKQSLDSMVHFSVNVQNGLLIFVKAALLYNENIHLSILISHFVHMKETYKNMDLLLKAISYSKYGWKICGDLKVIGLLLGMESGYTKLCYFLCEWDSWAKDKHYKLKDWPMPENSVPGKKRTRNQPLFDKDTICYWHCTLNWG